MTLHLCCLNRAWGPVYDRQYIMVYRDEDTGVELSRTEPYTKQWQDGLCVKCGSVKRREVSR